MNVERYLMKSMSDDEWVDIWKERIGFDKMITYRNELINYVESLEPGTEVDIEIIVKSETVELFTKVFCMLVLEGLIKAQFVAQYSKIRKLKSVD